jgi:acid phosphatase type 7
MRLGLTLILCGFLSAMSVEQLHLAQGKNPTEMMVMWVDNDDTASECQYYATNEESSAKHLMKVSGVSSTYEFSWPTKEHEYKSGQLHHALLSDLEYSTEYTYRCNDSEEKTFKTLPAVGTLSTEKNGEVVFGVIGDLGTTKDSKITIEHCMSNDLDMMLHVGDLSYANCDQNVWDIYGREIEPLSSVLPWMVCAGNHEIEIPSTSDNGSGVFKAFEARYQMPQIKPAEFGEIVIPPSGECTPSVFQSEYNYGNSFYSFEASLVHVTVLNCYSVSNKNSIQYKFAQNDFENVNRNKTPWLVVIMHCPWYNSNTAHQQEAQTTDMKSNMEELFYKFNVNIAFQGHVHAYERTYPVYQDKINSKGTTYITIGDGGNKEGHAENYVQPTPEWSAYRNGTHYGHGTFRIFNSTVAKWEWNRNNDGVKVISDSVMINT